MDQQTLGTADLLEGLMKKYNSDKADIGHLYHLLYDKAFHEIRHDVTRVMEIGLALFKQYRPGNAEVNTDVDTSLKIWLDYFPNSFAVGVDINDYSFLDIPRTKIYQFDQSDAASLLSFKRKESEPFDIIIDDGSHVSHHQQLTLEHLFTQVRAGGYYCIEDLNLTFAYDTIDTGIRTVELLKKWADGVWENHGMDPERFAYLKDNIAGIEFNGDRGVERNRLAILRKKG
ncbi:MAG: hypothetical protein AAF672_07485 [Pseudomonadota bacterium]